MMTMLAWTNNVWNDDWTLSLLTVWSILNGSSVKSVVTSGLSIGLLLQETWGNLLEWMAGSELVFWNLLVWSVHVAKAR